LTLCNITENRAVLHVALRTPKDTSIVVDGRNVVPQAHAILDKMADFSDRVRDGSWKGHTGKRIRNVIKVRTMWSLSNAFTSAFKDPDPIPQFRATAKLGRLLQRGEHSVLTAAIFSTGSRERPPPRDPFL
jgi:hypothetical protein